MRLMSSSVTPNCPRGEASPSTPELPAARARQRVGSDRGVMGSCDRAGPIDALDSFNFACLPYEGKKSLRGRGCLVSQSALSKAQAAPQADLRLSDDMKQQLEAIASAKRHGGDLRTTNLKIVSFDGDLERAVPNSVIMWEKSTCC